MQVKKSNDIEEVKRLHKLIFPSDDADILETDEFWLVHNDKGKAVGFCSLRSLEHEIVFFNWAGLLYEAMGKGLHKRMVRARERWCRKNKYKTIITYTTLDNIQSASNILKYNYKLFMPEYRWAGKNCLYFHKNL